VPEAAAAESIRVARRVRVMVFMCVCLEHWCSVLLGGCVSVRLQSFLKLGAEARLASLAAA
jgi:hypothetical protein